MKMYLKRIIKFSQKPDQPDYESFFKGQNGKIFYAVGYLKAITSDLTLTIKEADFENEFQKKKYVNEWRDRINAKE